MDNQQILIRDEDLEALKVAKAYVVSPTVAAKLANIIGTPLEHAIKSLPSGVSQVITKVTEKSLKAALEFAVLTLDNRKKKKSADLMHKIFAGASGAVGGAFGFAALAVELPVTTTIIFRSIADIARSEGEDLSSIETKLACLEVFALGGNSQEDDAAESGYYAVRAALTKLTSEAARHLTEKSLTKSGANIVSRFITSLASRFGVVVTEKAAAMAIPIVGGAGGLIVNTIFIDHFQTIARGHFIIRRMERAYGSEMIRQIYEKIKID